MTDPLETPTKEAPIRPAFSPAAFSNREYEVRDINLKVPVGTTPEELLRPSIWAHYAKKLKTGTYIHVSDEGGTWHGIYCVSAAADSWANVYPLLVVKIPQAQDGDPTPPSERYKIDHIGSGWRVIQRETGKVIKDKLPQRPDAENFIRDEVSKNLKR